MKTGETKLGLARALAMEETDGAIDAAVRAFWTRAKPVRPIALPPLPRGPADVVDLRRWALARARATP